MTTYDINYATLNTVLNADAAPCPVGTSTYGVDQGDYDNTRNNSEAIVLLMRESAAATTGDELVTEGVPGQEITSSDEVEDEPITEDTTTASVEGEEVVEDEMAPVSDEVAEALETDPDNAAPERAVQVADDFVIEVIAGSPERVSQLVDWVYSKIEGLVFDPSTIGDYVMFRTPVEEIDVDKWATTTNR